MVHDTDLPTEKALLLQSHIAKLDSPSGRALTAFRTWFRGEFLAADGRDMGFVMGGLSRFALDDTGDLVGLETLRNSDPVSRLLRNYWPSCFSNTWRGRNAAKTNNARMTHFPERHVELVVTLINILTTIVLLFGGILVLVFVANPIARLGLIAFFMVAFAMAIGLLTNARRVELIAATAAYGAVLVVFVSSDFSVT